MSSPLSLVCIGIPTLVLLDQDLEVINQNARSFIEHDEKFEVGFIKINIILTITHRRYINKHEYLLNGFHALFL